MLIYNNSSSLPIPNVNIIWHKIDNEHLALRKKLAFVSILYAEFVKFADVPEADIILYLPLFSTCEWFHTQRLGQNTHENNLKCKKCCHRESILEFIKIKVLKIILAKL